MSKVENVGTDVVEEFTVPMSFLEAALICAAKQDVRFYLQGVAINEGHIVSTDGHRGFCAFHSEIPENVDVILPVKSVSNFIKKFKAKERIGRDVLVTLKRTVTDDSSHKSYEVKLSCGSEVELFNTIDANYPRWKKAFPLEPRDYLSEYNGVLPQFNWNYLADFTKINKILGGNGEHADIIPKSAKEVARVQFRGTKYDDVAFGVVMPLFCVPN